MNFGDKSKSIYGFIGVEKIKSNCYFMFLFTQQTVQSNRKQYKYVFLPVFFNFFVSSFFIFGINIFKITTIFFHVNNKYLKN